MKRQVCSLEAVEARQMAEGALSANVRDALASAVDSEFYRWAYGDLAPGATAALHYCEIGWRAGRDPAPWFSTSQYISRYPRLLEEGQVPLFHFLLKASDGDIPAPSTLASEYYSRSATTQDHASAPARATQPVNLVAVRHLLETHFDEAYYRALGQPLLDGVDALTHFILEGWKAGRDPCAWFSVTAYLAANPDVADAGTNPFLHYLAHGREEGRDPDSDCAGTDRSAGARVVAADVPVERTLVSSEARSNYEYVLDALALVGQVSIIVPIFNAPDKVETCIEAVLRNTTFPSELILVDDASTDRRISALLERYHGLPGIRILRNDKNLGFSGTVNRGIRECQGDVVLLNSDTSVGPRWLENILFAACQRPSIGTVTPLSNSAGEFSVVPEGASLWDIAPRQRDTVCRLVMQNSGMYYPSAPTANGFCMYIKRKVIDDTGYFDSDTFPRGYGEENDFCMRASHLGWEHIIDDATLVFHAQTASFSSDESRKLSEQGWVNVNRKHPDYAVHVKRFLESRSLASCRANGRRLPIRPAAAGQVGVAPRILHVLDDTSAAPLLFDPAFDSFAVTCDGNLLTTYRVGRNGLETVGQRALQDRTIMSDLRHPEYRAALYDVHARYRFELVHIHGLIGHTLDLPDVMARLRIPQVATFHGYYFACPSANLIDGDGKFCDGICTTGGADCDHGISWIAEGPRLKNGFVSEWRRRVSEAMHRVDAFIAPSQEIKERLIRLLPLLRDRVIDVLDCEGEEANAARHDVYRRLMQPRVFSSPPVKANAS